MPCHAYRALLRASPWLTSASRPGPGTVARQFSISLVKRSLHDQAATATATSTSLNRTPDEDPGGKSARRDGAIQSTYPTQSQLPKGDPVRGVAGRHSKPTLASFSLQGRTAVITGAARGLGLVMAQGLMKSGADIAIVDLNGEEAQRSALAMDQTFKEENPEADIVPKVTAHYADVSDPDSVDKTIATILSTHGKIDILVTSAGFTENFPAEAYPADRLRKLWGVNVDGTYFFATAVAKHLMERKAPGSLVFIGSMSGQIVNVPQPQAPYNASKAAVNHLARSLAIEWADKGIRVNTINPGYMLTALTEKILDDRPDLKDKWTSLIPVGKMGRPEDLMGAVVFLASDASNYMTGADIRIDGGYCCT